LKSVEALLTERSAGVSADGRHGSWIVESNAGRVSVEDDDGGGGMSLG
jgi:hypothetical protein